MSDELQLSINFDGSNAQSGLQQLADSAQEATSQISSSFNELITQAGAKVTALESQLQELQSAFEAAASKSDVLSGRAIGATGGAEEAAAYTEASQQEVQALEAVNEATIELATARQELAGVTSAFSASEAALTGELSAEAAELDASNAAWAAYGATLNSIPGEEAAIASTAANVTEELEAEAAIVQDSAEAYALAGGLLQQYTVQLGDGVESSADLTAALETLDNELAKGAGNLENIATAFETVQAEAQKAGLTFQQTSQGATILANSLNQVGNAAKSAAAGIDSSTFAMAYLAGRIGAIDIGLGQIGFAVGILGRNSAALAPIFAAALPIAGVVLAVEMISSLVDKYDKLQDQIRKTITASDDLATSVIRSSDQLQLEAFRLEDQINVLEGKPPENGLNEAFIENEEEAERLGKSFEDALTKLVQLQEQGKIGFFFRLTTGDEGTEVVDKTLVKKLEALQLAVSAQRVAAAQLEVSENDENSAAKDAADQRVEIARKAAQDELDTQRSKVTGLIEEAQKASNITTSVGGAPVTTPVPGLSKEEAEEKYASAASFLNAADVALKQNVVDEESLKKVIEDRLEKENQADEARQRAISRTTGEADLKSEEALAVKRAEGEKASAEQTFKITENQAKYQEQQAITSGENRYKAEIEADDKILEARKKLTKELLLDTGDKDRAQLTAARAQLELDQETEVGAKREAAIKTDNTRIKVLEMQLQDDISAITAASQEAILQLYIQEGEAKNKLEQESTRRAINELSREFAEKKRIIGEESKLVQDEINTRYSTLQSGVKGEESLTKKESQGGGGVIAATIELEEMKKINQEEIGLIFFKTQEEIALSNQRQAAIVEELNKEKETYKTLYDNGKITAEAYGKAVEDIERQITITTQIEADKRKELIAKEKDQEVKIAQDRAEKEQELEVKIADGMAREFDKMLFQSKSFSQAMQSLWQDLVRMIVEQITKMVAEWIVAHTIMAAIHKIFDKEVLTPGPGKKTEAEEKPPEIPGIYPGDQDQSKIATQTREVALTEQLSVSKQQLAIATQQVHVAESAQDVAQKSNLTTIQPLITSVSGLSKAENELAVSAREAGQAVGTAAGIATGIIASNSSLANSEIGAAAADAFAMTLIESGGTDIPGAVAKAAEVEAAGASYIAQASAAGGWDVPDDASSYNTVIHPKEMVLDRNISDGLRSIISRGMTSAPGHASESGGVPLNFHYHAGDMHAPTGMGVEEMLNSHPQAMSKMIIGLVKSGRVDPSKYASKIR